VRWRTKNDSGIIYEYVGHCDCKKGREWGHLISASAILDPFEISAIAKDNREYHKKMGGGLQKHEELKNG
jgi:hypothetical protein